MSSRGSLQSPKRSEFRLRRSGLMTAYQFAFYTLYQACHWNSSDKFSLWKAGNIITALEVCILLSIVAGVNIVRHTNYWPVGPLIIAGLLLGVLTFHTFDYRDRWKPYAEEFRRYSATRLFVSRLLFVAVVVVIVSTVILTLGYYRQLNSAP